jgi:hypothetical protein
VIRAVLDINALLSGIVLIYDSNQFEERLMATTAQIAPDYAYRDDGAVRAYLEEHPGVVSVLDKASQVLPRYFGANPLLVLDVLIDPEEPESISLFILIQTRMAPDVALPQLDRFNDGWWRGASMNLDADVHFGLDYV